MGTESSSTQGAPKNVSRRRVVAGAAWSVPAVMVASAAPAVAASPGFLTFTGRACKLPGNSSSTFKGYVFELEADNILGPQPSDAVTVILSVVINQTSDPNFTVVVKSPSPNPVCSCTGCGGVSANGHRFCTPDGVVDQKILLYTSADLTGNSQNTTATVTYQVYDCSGTNACGTPGPIQTATSGFNDIFTAQEAGGNCPIPNVFPLPGSPA